MRVWLLARGPAWCLPCPIFSVGVSTRAQFDKSSAFVCTGESSGAAALPRPWHAEAEAVRIVARVASKRQMARLLAFVDLLPSATPILPQVCAMYTSSQPKSLLLLHDRHARCNLPGICLLGWQCVVQFNGCSSLIGSYSYDLYASSAANLTVVTDSMTAHVSADQSAMFCIAATNVCYGVVRLPDIKVV
jgi:hypothetical protein